VENQNKECVLWDQIRTLGSNSDVYSKSSISIVPTFQELFQNPINISIKEEKNQIVEFV
jgi:hypothetical protein